MLRGRRSRLLLVAALAAAVLLVPAASASSSGSGHRSPYAGLGTWVDIFSTSAWASPERATAAMARQGVRTLYLQTGNYSQPGALVRPRLLGRFIDAAHAEGMHVVAWYLPAFTNPRQDLQRSLAAIRFRSAHGERFDSFSLDIEASLVHPVSLRTERLLQLSARLRKAVGARYALGAITPGPAGLRRHPHYWPGFPYRSLARSYDVFLPMAYATNYVHGSTATRAYDAADVAGIRAATGNPNVPIHLIGGIAGTMGTREAAGFMQAVADCHPLGYSLYDFPITSTVEWKALTSPAAAAGAQWCG